MSRQKNDPIIPFWDKPLVPFRVEDDQGKGVPRQCVLCGGMIASNGNSFKCARCNSDYGADT